MNDRLLAVRAVAVVRWLRHHPLVEAGPGVRGSHALAELADARLRLGRSDASDAEDAAFLAAALVALPHRLRVRPGVDADELVRQAVAEALWSSPDDGDPLGLGNGDSRGEAGGEEGIRVALPIVSSGNRPATSEEEQALRAAFGDDEAARFLDELLEPGAALPPAAGPAPTRPGRRAVGEEILAVRPFRPGDRARDFSARQTVRASLRTGSLAPRALSRQPSAVWDVTSSPSTPRRRWAATNGRWWRRPRPPLPRYWCEMATESGRSPSPRRRSSPGRCPGPGCPCWLSSTASPTPPTSKRPSTPPGCFWSASRPPVLAAM